MKKWIVYDNKNNKKEINILDVTGIGILRYVHNDPEQPDLGLFNYVIHIHHVYGEYWMNSYTYPYEAAVDVKFYLIEWAEAINEYGRERWEKETKNIQKDPGHYYHVCG